MDTFKDIIKLFIPILKEAGYNKKGNSFYIESGKNYGIINFQKSRESNKELLRFTINFGIFSYALGILEYYNSDSITLKPEVDKCHWHARVGAFKPGSPDYWWEVYNSDNLNIVVPDVRVAIECLIIPEINKRINDDDLLNCWMTGLYAGTTEIGRFKYVTTLLKAKSDFELLDQVVDKFNEKSKGRPIVILAKEHLETIGYKQ